jgi:hypothetical protein
VHLTEAGSTLLATANPVRMDAVVDVMSALSGEQRARLARLCRRIVKALAPEEAERDSAEDHADDQADEQADDDTDDGGDDAPGASADNGAGEALPSLDDALIRAQSAPTVADAPAPDAQ